MAYATLTDIREQMSEDELIPLTSDDGTLDESVVERAIADADGEIDAYVGYRMEVPLDPVPVMIRKYSVDIAIYNLYARRLDICPDMRRKRYEDAVKFMRLVAEGKISLGQNDPAGNPPTLSSPAYMVGVDRVMTADKLSRF